MTNHKPQATEPKITKWTSNFDDQSLESRFRDDTISDQKTRATFFAWMIAIIPAIQIYGEFQQFIFTEKSLFIEVIPRIFCTICSLGFILKIKTIKNYVVLDRWSTAYGIGLIIFTIYLMIVRPQLSSIMLIGGLFGTVAVIYFFVPLSVIRVSILGFFSSLGGVIACLYVRVELRPEWLQLALWMIALNGFGYFGIRSQSANLRRIYWQNKELILRQSELEIAYQQEKDSFRRFLQFSELIGHEFRNALAIIKGKAQLLQLTTEIDQPIDTSAPIIIENTVNRIEGLFSRWLASNSIVESEFTLTTQAVLLGDLFEKLKAETKWSPSHSLRFHPAPNVEIEVDSELMLIALHNIIDNAVKYSPNGSKIEISANVLADCIEITIADNGIGIAPSEREMIFDQYYRSSYDNGISGLGLGLYMVRRLVTLHDGSVRAEENNGQGSRFVISLPYLSSSRS